MSTAPFVSFQQLDNPIFNEKNNNYKGKQLKKLLLASDQQIYEKKQHNQQQRKKKHANKINQKRLQRQQKAKRINLSDDKYISKIYTKTIKAKDHKYSIKKNQLGQNLNILQIKEVEGFNENQFFKIKKQSQQNKLFPVPNAKNLILDLTNINNQIIQFQQYPLSSLQYPHLKDIRQEIYQNFQWASIKSKGTCFKNKLKTKILTFQKRAQLYESNISSYQYFSQKNKSNKIKTQEKQNKQVSFSSKRMRNSFDGKLLTKTHGILKKAHSLKPQSKQDYQNRLSSIALQNDKKFSNKTIGQSSTFIEKKNNIQPSLRVCEEQQIDIDEQQQNNFNEKHQLMIGTQKKIDFQSLSLKQKFIKTQEKLRSKYEKKMPGRSKSKGYLTNNRVQGLFQCQILKSGKKIFGQKKYLEYMSHFLKQIDENKQQLNNDQLSSKMYNNLGNRSSTCQTPINYSNMRTPLQWLYKEKKKNTVGQASQAQLILYKNKQRIAQQRKRNIQKLRY